MKHCQIPIIAPSTAAALLDPSERQRCEVWTRVMGYHRPVSSFNTGKIGEYNERVTFEETISVARKSA